MYPHQKLDWSASRLEARLAEHPDDTAARLELARVCLSRGLWHAGGENQCSAALQHARKLLQDEPSAAEAMVIAGAALVGIDRPEAAQKYLDEAIRIAPDRADLHFALGAMYRGQGDRHLAIRHLETSCRADPAAWEVHLLLGRTLAEGVPLARDTTTDLALTSYTLSGTLTANGVTLEDPEGTDDWTLTATEVSSGDVFLETQDGPSIHILLPPGTYDLAYLGVNQQIPFAGATVPLEAAYPVTADSTVELALTSYPVAANLAYNGVPFAGAWALAFTDTYTTLTAATSGPDVTLEVPPGVYAAEYVNVDGAEPFPGAVVGLAGSLEVGR